MVTNTNKLSRTHTYVKSHIVVWCFLDMEVTCLIICLKHKIVVTIISVYNLNQSSLGLLYTDDDGHNLIMYCAIFQQICLNILLATPI